MSSFRSFVRESRALDGVFDPVYTRGSHSLASSSSSSSTQGHTAPAYRPALFATSDGSDVHLQGPPALFSSSAVATAPHLRELITGPGRLSFFRRPVRALVAPLAGPQRPGDNRGTALIRIPDADLLSLSAAQLSSDAADDGGSHGEAASGAEGAAPLPRSVGVQSEYRESGSQTLPYSPDVLLDAEPSAHVRELLSLQSSLSFAKGTLPASLAEVEAIEAARAKAAWEAALPPLTSASNFEERQRRVQEREWREWRLKEEAQRAEEDGRMRSLIRAMEERQRQQAAAVEAVKAERLRAAEERAQAAAERRTAEKRRAVRVLGKQRLREERRAAFMTGGLADVAAPASVAAKSSTASASSAASALLSGLGSDAVFAAVEFGSAVYAPLARSGAVRAAKGRRAIVDFDIPALQDFDALRTFDRRQTEDEEARRKLHRLPHLPPPTRQQLLERSRLQRVDDRLLEEKEQLSDTQSPSPSSLNAYKAYQPLVRAPTPSLPRTAASDAALTVAVSALQRLLRGRAAQNRSLRGQQCQEGLIEELSHSRPPPQAKAQSQWPQSDEADEEATEEGSRDDGSARRRRGRETGTAEPQPTSTEADAAVSDAAFTASLSSPPASALVDALLGVVWSDAVYALGAGWQAEAQLQALASLQSTLSFVRRVRESEEGGRRQAEEERRRERERSLQRLTRSLQTTVIAHHCADIVQAAVRRSVDAQWEEQREQQQSAAASAVAASVPSSAVISSLLDDILFPSVVRHAAATSAALQQRRLLVSGHGTAQWAVEEAVREAAALQTSAAIGPSLSGEPAMGAFAQ